MDRNEKAQEVEFLAQQFRGAQIALSGDYQGLTVAQITKLRRDIRKAGGRGWVVKNTLAGISADRAWKDKFSGSEVEKFLSTLTGPSFVIFSESDPIAPTKALAEFCKANKKFKVKGAFFEGNFVDPSGVEQLSKMPGKAETLSMLLRLIQEPATRLLRLMQTPGTQLTRVIDAQRQNLESKPA